ncbi:MAG: hypothetical protein ACR2N4_03440 [Jatrophihabitans sp.]
MAERAAKATNRFLILIGWRPDPAASRRVSRPMQIATGAVAIIVVVAVRLLLHHL